ncbi:hypothetical protein BRADI_5g15785v3 [Brachypodium distachyon]|uniref:Uncharacterized protein n=1 Tax=Brachypodium distachyon TaxID=15368 RepID=A0A2K2CHI1_BRADI|nr:hypothetical protein BRADI_5g15785v3 [Brachypodium distachyon]
MKIGGDRQRGAAGTRNSGVILRWWCASVRLGKQKWLLWRNTSWCGVKSWVHDSTHQGSNPGAHNYALGVSPTVFP